MGLAARLAPGPGAPFFSTAKSPFRRGPPRTWTSSSAGSTVKIPSSTRCIARASHSNCEPTLARTIGERVREVRLRLERQRGVGQPARHLVVNEVDRAQGRR
eukprot:783287-Pyramimonas_sp.AAC.1